MLVLAHRHNKNDDYMKDSLVDFDTVRKPMYKYSKQAMDTFFGLSTFAFLFAWFASCPSGQTFAEQKFTDNSDKGHLPRLMQEVNFLKKEAYDKLQEHVQCGSTAATDSSKRVNLQTKNGCQ